MMSQLEKFPMTPHGLDLKLPRSADELYRDHQLKIYKEADFLFACLMAVQWLFGVALAVWLSPLAWSGIISRTHPHIGLAVFLGAAIVSLPIWMAIRYPGVAATRHVIALGQAMSSGLLIHLAGGRIEMHFHVFGSLALLSFYRDWRVLVTASTWTALDP